MLGDGVSPLHAEVLVVVEDVKLSSKVSVISQSSWYRSCSSEMNWLSRLLVRVATVCVVRSTLTALR